MVRIIMHTSYIFRPSDTYLYSHPLPFTTTTEETSSPTLPSSQLPSLRFRLPRLFLTKKKLNQRKLKLRFSLESSPFLKPSMEFYSRVEPLPVISLVKLRTHSSDQTPSKQAKLTNGLITPLEPSTETSSPSSEPPSDIQVSTKLSTLMLSRILRTTLSSSTPLLKERNGQLEAQSPLPTSSSFRPSHLLSKLSSRKASESHSPTPPHGLKEFQSSPKLSLDSETPSSLPKHSSPPSQKKHNE